MSYGVHGEQVDIRIYSTTPSYILSSSPPPPPRHWKQIYLDSSVTGLTAFLEGGKWRFKNR